MEHPPTGSFDHQEAADLFIEARELRIDQRPGFLDARCKGRDALRREVEEMLANEPKPGEFSGAIEREMARAADETLPEDESEVPTALPEEIGPYKIEGFLGRGGFGVVYKARQRSPDRLVALKVMQSSVNIEEAGPRTKRFQREIAVTGRLQHPGIGRVYDAGRAETREGPIDWFALELIEGKDGEKALDLFSHCRDLDHTSKLVLFAKLCDAVDYAHGKGVVHRDLKPANILIDGSGQPKVLDFGIAQVEDQSRISVIGRAIGTAAYMSPEQARGDHDNIKAASDVFSLGIILFEILSSQLPFRARNLQSDDPTPLSSIDRAFRGDLDVITTTALEKEIDRRYKTAGELGADVRRFLSSEPIRARPASTLYQLQKFARKNRVFVGGVAGTLLALLLGLGVSLYLLGRERTALAEYERMADVRLVQDLVRQAGQDLWPRRPGKIKDMKAWLDEAIAVADRLPQHRESLNAIEAQGTRVENGWMFEGEGDKLTWKHDVMMSLVAELERFRGEGGLIIDVGQRLVMAETIEKETVTKYESEWGDVIAMISTSPRYGGLGIKAQVGLVPLGADPKSGLLEFWLKETGERPERDSNGRWLITGVTGVIMILLPGDHGFHAGWQRDNQDAAYYDHLFNKNETPVLKNSPMKPFFISKYEITQGQWYRITQHNPSFYIGNDPGQNDDHPVENVSWFESRDGLNRVELRLPNTYEWEYAARGGTTTTWWFGNDPELLANTGNVADESYGAGDEVELGSVEPWDDGYSDTAPVGAFEPNPFGLFDTVGNVWEWCEDKYEDDDDYRNAERRVLRGGCYTSGGLTRADTTSASWLTNITAPNAGVGIRPVRSLR